MFRNFGAQTPGQTYTSFHWLYRSISMMFKESPSIGLYVSFVAMETHTILTKLTPWSRILLKKLIVTQLEEILCALCNPKVHYHLRNSSPLVAVVSNKNLFHNLSPFFFKMYSDIILPSTPRSYKSSLLSPQAK
jgi:hypothetical protein